MKVVTRQQARELAKEERSDPPSAKISPVGEKVGPAVTTAAAAKTTVTQTAVEEAETSQVLKLKKWETVTVVKNQKWQQQLQRTQPRRTTTQQQLQKWNKVCQKKRVMVV